MSKLNINPDLFLGAHELNKWQNFLQDDGYIKLLLENSISFGLIHKEIVGGNWTNFQVNLGDNSGTIKIQEGIAIDKDGKVIRSLFKNNISSIPNDSAWRWIKISHQYSPIEPYLVSISNTGSLTAPGGSLLSILRGTSNNQTRIAFPNATQNIYEYDVVEVIDDENAVLAGDFIAESNIQLAVVGSFTPDTITPSGSKYPFQYDSCLMTYVLESVPNTPPAISDDTFFWIARVKRTGNSIVIEDKRSLNIWRTKADYNTDVCIPSDNPLIGVEAITFDSAQSTRDQNLISVGFTFRSNNWTLSSSDNRITLITGVGGKFKSTADFTDGDFDNWRLYAPDGTYSIIKQSALAFGQINLILDSVDPAKFLNTSQQLVVAPDAEEIEIFCLVPTEETDHTTEIKVIKPINTNVVSIPLTVYKAVSCVYVIQYRYKTGKSYSQLASIPNSTYYPESQFTNGVQTGFATVAYTNSRITLTQANNSYSNVIGSLSSGQLFGYEYLPLDNSNPIRNVYVGQNKENIIITQEVTDSDMSDADFDAGGVPYVLTADHYISFSSLIPSTQKNGNSFEIQIRGTYQRGAGPYGIFLTSDYINPGSTGIILAELSDSDLEQAAIDNLVFRVYWDGIHWQAFKKIYVRNDTQKIFNAELTTTSGGGTQTILTIPHDASKTGIYEAKFVAKYISGGTGPVGAGHTAQKLLSVHGPSGTVTSLGGDTIASHTSSADVTSFNIGVSGGDVVASITVASGAVLQVFVRVSLLEF